MQRKRATLKDVANDVGVHVSTVSRALNPATRHLITREIAERIEEASRRLGYRINTAAYSLRTNRTKMVGVVVPDITNSIFPPIIRGVEDALLPHGYATLVVNTDGRAEREAAILDALSARGVDGLVVASVQRVDEAISELAASGARIVTVNRSVEDAAIPSVVSDDAQGVRLMLEHLRSLGHRRIAEIAGNQKLSTGKARHDAFRAHARALGMQVASSRFAQMFNEAQGETCMDDLLAGERNFTAVLCANDRLAIGALASMRRHGLKCPRDLSVTGFNDMAMVDSIDPPLTTVRVQQYKVGYRAAEILLDLMNGARGRAGSEITLPVELVVRESTAAPAGVAVAAQTRRPRVRTA